MELRQTRWKQIYRLGLIDLGIFRDRGHPPLATRLFEEQLSSFGEHFHEVNYAVNDEQPFRQQS